MPTYLSPGVYVEEVSPAPKPIEGVGTAIAAFVGMAPKGPANTPTLVTNWRQYVEKFGDITAGAYLGHAVYGYFLNGGGNCYVVRVGAEQRRRRAASTSRRRAPASATSRCARSSRARGQRHDDRGVRPAGGLARGHRAHRHQHAATSARSTRPLPLTGRGNVVNTLNRSRLVRVELDPAVAPARGPAARASRR